MVTSELLAHGLIRNEQSYYDAYGRVKATYDASGEGVLYQYNNQGHLEITQGIRTGVEYQKVLSKNAFGHVTKEVAGNGVYTYREYDLSGRLELLMSGRTDGGSELQYMTFEYDAVGNMKTRWDSRDIDTYTKDVFDYDNVNRLLKSEVEYADVFGSVINFTDYDITYDEGGRRDILKRGTETPITYSYDPQHIHGVQSTSDGKSYEYDAVGNQEVSDGRLITYTAFNKASSMSNGNYSVDYTYGSSNEKLTRRDIKNGKETLTWYVGNTEIILSDWSDGIAGKVSSKRYLGSNAMVTHHGPDIIDVDYMHKDHLGSIQVYTKQLNDWREDVSYDAFGNTRAIWDPASFANFATVSLSNKGFTGQDHVSELSLINFNARMYDPKLGMMLQADTIVPDGPAVDSLNRYAYVYNNPLSYTDPTGHIPTPNLFAAAAVNNYEALRQMANKVREVTTGVASKIFSGSRKDNAHNQGNYQNFLQNQKSVGSPAGVNNGSFSNNNYALGFSDNGQGWNGSDVRSQPDGKDLAYRPGLGLSDSNGNRYTQGKWGNMINIGSEQDSMDNLKSIGRFMNPFQDVSECYSSGCGLGGWAIAIAAVVPQVKWGKRGGDSIQSLYHYTDDKGLDGIVSSGKLNPSLKANNPKDARYGNGQYFSDIAPGSKSNAQLSRAFLGRPFHGDKFKNYLEIDVSGFNVLKGRDGVFVFPNENALDISKRILRTGSN